MSARSEAAKAANIRGVMRDEISAKAARVLGGGNSSNVRLDCHEWCGRDIVTATIYSTVLNNLEKKHGICGIIVYPCYP